MRLALYALLILLAGSALLWAFPGHAALALGALLSVVLALGAWGTLSLRSGIWCRAVTSGSPDGGRVALTYDDGPDPRATPALLELLADRGVRASFFCVGERVRANPELVRRMAAAGHELGNHGDSHSRWTNFFPRRRLTRELEACQRAIEEAGGVKPRWYRPPFGLANHATQASSREVGLEVVGWQVRGLDLPGSEAQPVARRVLDGLREGGIVLLHDGDREPELVVAATRAVLDGLEQRGLRPVTLSELLERPPGSR